MKKAFARYVLPGVLGMLGISCYILADTFFIARGIGADGLTALNLAIPIYSFMHGTGLMIGMGGATRFAISKSNTVFTESLYLVLGVSTFFFIIGVCLCTPLTTVLGTDSVTFPLTFAYLRTILCFAPAFLLNNLLICFVRNDGDPGLSMAGMLLGSLSNIILDYIFIFPWNMGMFGAALATGIAPMISLSILSLHFIKKKSSFSLSALRPRLSAFWDIASLGSSSLIAEFSSGIVMLIFNFIILGLAGNTGVAAYGIIANISLVITSIFTGIAQGCQPILSKSYGQSRTADIKKICRYGITTALIFAAVIYLATYAFSQPICAVFNKDRDPELARIAVSGMRLYFIAFFFVGFNLLTITRESACDRPQNAFFISLLRGFLLLVPTSFLMASLLGMTGVWLSLTVTEAVVSVFSFYVLRGAPCAETSQ